MNSGSLGHGLGVGVGMALADKMDEKNYRVYVVVGDREVAEGSVWEVGNDLDAIDNAVELQKKLRANRP